MSDAALVITMLTDVLMPIGAGPYVGTVLTNTVECRYNAVQYCKILYKYLYWIEAEHQSDAGSTKDTPYLAQRTSYGVSFVHVCKKSDSAITAPYYIHTCHHPSVQWCQCLNNVIQNSLRNLNIKTKKKRPPKEKNKQTTITNPPPKKKKKKKKNNNKKQQ